MVRATSMATTPALSLVLWQIRQVWAQSTTGGPELYKRKMAEQARGIQPMSSVLPWSLLQFPPLGSCLSSWPDFPSRWTVTCKPNKPCPPQVVFGCGVHHSGRKRTGAEWKWLALLTVSVEFRNSPTFQKMKCPVWSVPAVFISLRGVSALSNPFC